MIYYATSGDRELKLEVIDNENEEINIKLPDGRTLTANFEPNLGNNIYSLLLDGKSYEIYITPGENGEIQVYLSGQLFSVSLETERAHRYASLSGSKHGTGEVSIKAPMPGLVTIVSVTPGDAVEAGQRVLVLEAMKMENEIRAPRAGKVKSVNVQKGQTVEQNKVLIVLE